MSQADHRAFQIEEESYFVSMTDLMVGMLFIFIIMLMAFTLDLREEQDKLSQTTTTLTEADAARRQMLEDIKSSLEKLGVTVSIDVENGVVRLPEELLFPRGQDDLTPKGQDAVRKLAEVLSRILPCYAVSSLPQTGCSNARKGRLEAVFIEGHTDDRPIAGRLPNGVSDNWGLSTQRAIKTFTALTQQAPALKNITNDSRLKLLGVSGYADSRPLKTDDTEEARAANRRIDLRFLMETPNSEQIKAIRNQIEIKGSLP